MEVLEATQGQQRSVHLQSLLDLADLVAATSPDMRVPELEEGHLSTGQLAGTGHQASGSGVQVQPSALDRAAQKDAAVLSIMELRHKYGQPRADRAIAVVQSQAPTAQQAYAVCEREVRAAYAKRGKALQALSNPPMQHSVQDYELVICTQLEQWALGNAPSVSEVLRIEFPDDPAKAKSIRGSTRVKRWKEAYNSDAVRNHPMEIAMRLTLDKSSINGRLMARNFGQSLSMNAALFKSSGRITKLNVLVEEQGTRISVLEQQMQETKTRESLADAGCATSREMVLALSLQGKGRTEIASALGMKPDTVKKALQRARKAA